MTGIWDDIRQGLRRLAKSRLSTLTAIASLALGIGANTTVVTMLNAMLMRPLPVREPDRLATVYTVDPRNSGLLGCSYPNYVDYRDRNTVFEATLLSTPITINLTGQGDPQLLMGAIVSGNYFSALGVNPVVGRAFRPEEDVSPGANAVAVISHGLWNRLYGGDPNVTGRTIRLNGYEFSIVGVAPEGFHGLNYLYAADVWVPLMMYPQVFPTPALVNQRRAAYFSMVGRLKPGVTLAQAQAALQATSRALERDWPREIQGRALRLVPVAAAALTANTRGVLVDSGKVLLIISALVLLIACVNVANLLLARGAERNKEIAIRLAMGSSRWQLVRQLLVESTLLSLAGALAGLAVARWSRDLLWALRPPMFRHAAFRLDLDLRVVGYTFAVALLTGIFFGLFPALRATRADLATDLKERAGRGAVRLGRWNLRSLLVIEQVAFSLITLVAAGLFLRSMQNAARLDPGFDLPHLATVVYNIADHGYNEARGREFQRAVLERAAAVPGVDAVTLAKDLPLKAQGARHVLLPGIDSGSNGQGRLLLTSVVWPGYFRAVRMNLLRGRDFSTAETKDSPRKAIVNEVAAASLFPGEDALGKMIEFGGENLPCEIVGIVRNAVYRDFAEPVPPMIYLSLSQYYFPYGTVFVHTAGDPEAVLAAVRQEIHKLDPNLVLQTETAKTTLRELLWVQRLSGQLLAAFGFLALTLSTLGIYGVVSYSVTQRVREIGVRMALGATLGDVQTLVLGEGVRILAVGVVAGLAVSLATAPLVKNMLLVVSPRDALTFVLVPSILTLVAILACWLPAMRATRIDPAVALRDE